MNEFSDWDSTDTKAATNQEPEQTAAVTPGSSISEWTEAAPGELRYQRPGPCWFPTVAGEGHGLLGLGDLDGDLDGAAGVAPAVPLGDDGAQHVAGVGRRVSVREPGAKTGRDRENSPVSTLCPGWKMMKSKSC